MILSWTVYRLPAELAEWKAKEEEERSATAAAAARKAADRRTDDLSQVTFREDLTTWIGCLINLVGNGNWTRAQMHGMDTATVRIEGVETEALLQSLRQIRARLQGACIVPIATFDSPLGGSNVVSLRANRFRG